MNLREDIVKTIRCNTTKIHVFYKERFFHTRLCVAQLLSPFSQNLVSQEAFTNRFSVKKVLLEISQSSQENTIASVSASGLQLY